MRKPSSCWNDRCRPSSRPPLDSSSLQWAFSLLFLFLLWFDGNNVGVVVVVQAMVCHLEDENGKEVPLGSLYPPPPFDPSSSSSATNNRNTSNLLVNAQDRGVHYDPENNKLQCTLPNSCRRWKIQGCSLVICHGPHSCQDAMLVENQGIACWAYAACQNARLLGVQKVACGLDADTINTCMGTIMDVETSVLCFGPFSCAVADWQDHLTVAVGSKGMIQCYGSGFRALSCQNILVEVPQSYRACIATNVNDTRSCAVVCRDALDCDQSSIQFTVVGP